MICLANGNYGYLAKNLENPQTPSSCRLPKKYEIFDSFPLSQCIASGDNSCILSKFVDCLLKFQAQKGNLIEEHERPL